MREERCLALQLGIAQDMALRWLIWPMLITAKDAANFFHSVTVTRKLGTTKYCNKKFCNYYKKTISLRNALEITLLLLFILMSSPLLCPHLLVNLMFRILHPIQFPNDSNLPDIVAGNLRSSFTNIFESPVLLPTLFMLDNQWDQASEQKDGKWA